VLNRSSRRGFTLVEIMLAMVIMLVVSAALYQLLVATQRVAGAQAERLGLQANVRGAALVVRSELAELGTSGEGATDSDIISIAPSAISYRASRGFGYACQAVSGSQIRIGRNHFTGHRDPQAGRDSVWVYVEGSAAQADSGWIPLGIASISTAAPCTGSAEPGITITTSTPSPSGAFPAGTPVRIYERVELALYQSEGLSWLGMKSVSAGEVIQPLFGPLAGRDGFHLLYFDEAGLPTALSASVRSIAFTLRGVGQQPPSMTPNGRQPETEELTTQVALRNASR